MADHDLATFGANPSAAAALEHAEGLDQAFRIALDATHDRKAVIRGCALTAEALLGRDDLIDALQYQWPFMTQLQCIQIWAGDTGARRDLTGTLRLGSSSIIPTVIPTIVAHTLFHAAVAAQVATLVISFVAIVLGCRLWFKLRVARMTESTAIDIVHARLVEGAAKYPQRVPGARKMQMYFLR